VTLTPSPVTVTKVTITTSKTRPSCLPCTGTEAKKLLHRQNSCIAQVEGDPWPFAIITTTDIISFSTTVDFTETEVSSTTTITTTLTATAVDYVNGNCSSVIQFSYTYSIHHSYRSASNFDKNIVRCTQTRHNYFAQHCHGYKHNFGKVFDMLLISSFLL
jgi:hypothetical protein